MSTKADFEKRQEFLKKNKCLGDMEGFCGRAGDIDLTDCMYTSKVCKKANEPSKDTCRKCMCSVCVKSAPKCHVCL
jgi:hypothetical protein